MWLAATNKNSLHLEEKTLFIQEIPNGFLYKENFPFIWDPVSQQSTAERQQVALMKKFAQFWENNIWR